MPSNYWERYSLRRSNRRRFLQAGAGAGLGAAGLALVGCGGDDDDAPDLPPSGGAPSSGTNATGNETPQRGGTYLVDLAGGDPPTIDPYANASYLTKGIALYSYSRLYKYKTGAGILPLDVRPTPDLAESAEPNPDGTEWVVKLRRGQKFHDIDPVNGREVTTDDVKFSWGRLTAETSANQSLVKFVERVEFVDDTTMRFVLDAPNATFLDVLADSNALLIMPTEAEGGFDPKLQMIGSGPWVMRNYQVGIKFDFDANREWNVPGFPLFDHAEVSPAPEYSARLAHFLSGKSYTFVINSDDMLAARNQIDGMQYNTTTGGGTSFLYFGPNDEAFKDERVRRAVSMALHRDDLLELGYNIKRLRDAGFETEAPWANVIPPGFSRFWLDPQSDEAGESGQYFQYNPAESRKLLEAAGHLGTKFKYQYTGNAYSKITQNIAEQQFNYLTDAGFNVETEVQDYNSKYITQTFMGNFTGIAFGPETGFNEPGAYLSRLFSPHDPYNHGKVNDADLWQLTQDQARELDEEKRQEIVKEAQRLNGVRMWYVPSQVSAGPAWTVYQPFIRGIEHRTRGYGGGTEVAPYYWRAS